MSELKYWIIDYSITFCSDFHVGAGITMLGGNHHGLQTDREGLPFLGGTEVRGLIRQGGYKLKSWNKDLEKYFLNNYGTSGRDGFWSYTPARFQYVIPADILGEQSHIQVEKGRLFSYQKSGGTGQNHKWQGKIYSVKPIAETNVGFVIASMRVEDRIGHRRTRGYGKVNWQIESVRHYSNGTQPTQLIKSLDDWLRLGLTLEGGQHS